jgi:hypothetical protein
MTMRFIAPPNPVFNAVVSGSTPVQSLFFNMQGMFSAQACWIIAVGAGLTATFQVMVSKDGVNYYDSGEILPSVSGSALTFPAEYSGSFPFVLIQITPSVGSGSVVITGSAKGGA